MWCLILREKKIRFVCNILGSGKMLLNLNKLMLKSINKALFDFERNNKICNKYS